MCRRSWIRGFVRPRSAAHPSRLRSFQNVTPTLESASGVPRLVNILAHKALLLTYGEGARRAERRHVRVAVDDTPAATTPWWWFKAA